MVVSAIIGMCNFQKTDRRYGKTLAIAAAAKNPASVLLNAVTAWVLERNNSATSHHQCISCRWLSFLWIKSWCWGLNWFGNNIVWVCYIVQFCQHALRQWSYQWTAKAGCSCLIHKHMNRHCRTQVLQLKLLTMQYFLVQYKKRRANSKTLIRTINLYNFDG